MTAVAAVSSDISIAASARVSAAPVSATPAVTGTTAVTADKGQTATAAQSKFAVPSAAADNISAAALQTRTVTFSDAATGILIQADQNATTGAVISQFPDRALIESYAQQLRMGDLAQAAGNSVNT